MKNLTHEEENIVENIRHLFRLEKETKEVKDKILRDIKNLFEEYYKSVRVYKFWSDNHIEYKSKGEKNS